MVTYKILEAQDAKKLALFEAMARKTEPSAFFEAIDVEQYEKQILMCMGKADFQNTYVVLAMEDETIVGRCDFAVIGSFMNGQTVGYVDWVYVLKPYRHRGIAQKLFAFLEQHLRERGVEEYFLITARNEEAQQFYSSFTNSEKETDWILRKSLH